MVSVFVLQFVFSESLQSQVVDSLKVEVEEITISAARIESKLFELPMAASSASTNIDLNLSQKKSLQDFIGAIPGVFSLNANNYAQDLRISIRGFGARSAFGIRGVKLIVDGIPESTPDGQGQLDNLDLNNIQKIETLRGPASGLYGNASGGVIKIQTLDDFEKNFIKIGMSYGAFNTSNAQLTAGMHLAKSQIILSANHFESASYRNYSKTETSIFSAKVNSQISEKTKVKLVANYTNSPIAEDPGGIIFIDVTTDPKQARQRNIDFKSGEEIEHFKLGGSIEIQGKNKSFHSSIFYHNRQFDGRLPFEFGGMIDLSRHYYGHSSYVQFENNLNAFKNTLQIGYDLYFQNDKRMRYQNLNGNRGVETLNQKEKFYNYALYITDRINLGNKINLNVDTRLDINHVGNEDEFLSDGDDSSDKVFESFNFGLGASYKYRNGLIPYARIASSFEMPTLSELSANPQGGGFSENLDPIESYNYEIGLKGNLTNFLSYQSSLFYIESTNEILPFELEAFPNRDFFRNAGSTSRVGTELSVNFEKPNLLSVGLSYTWSKFMFEDYIVNESNLSGNILPGIPTHLLALNLNYHLFENFILSFQNKYVGDFFADDNNEVLVKKVLISDLNLHNSFKSDRFLVSIYGGVNNLFETFYFDNIRINAFGGRYYEAAAGRYFYIGASLKIE